jgi:hypothetical protein
MPSSKDADNMLDIWYLLAWPLLISYVLAGCLVSDFVSILGGVRSRRFILIMAVTGGMTTYLGLRLCDVVIEPKRVMNTRTLKGGGVMIDNGLYDGWEPFVYPLVGTGTITVCAVLYVRHRDRSRST